MPGDPVAGRGLGREAEQRLSERAWERVETKCRRPTSAGTSLSLGAATAGAAPALDAAVVVGQRRRRRRARRAREAWASDDMDPSGAWSAKCCFSSPVSAMSVALPVSAREEAGRSDQGDEGRQVGAPRAASGPSGGVDPRARVRVEIGISPPARRVALVRASQQQTARRPSTALTTLPTLRQPRFAAADMTSATASTAAPAPASNGASLSTVRCPLADARHSSQRLTSTTRADPSDRSPAARGAPVP